MTLSAASSSSAFSGSVTFTGTSGAVTNYGVDNPGLGTTDANLRTAISSDNSRVYFNDDGYVFSIDTATDKILSASDNPGCCYGDYDLTLAAGQQQFEATSFLYDANLNADIRKRRKPLKTNDRTPF
ncbi:MAG: hypothetical protein WA197_17735 [Candidatus Acidiferrales bacterium]